MLADPLPAAFAALLRCGATLVSPLAGRQTLLILIFHRVLPEPDPLLPEEPDVHTFAAQLGIIRAACSVLPLWEAVERLYKGSLPRKAACITFDDGYANNLTYAVPILESLGLTATVFVATGFLGGGRMWNDTILDAVRQAKEELDLSRIGLGRFELPDATGRRSVAQKLVGALKYLQPSERDEKALQIAELAGADSVKDPMLSAEQVRTLARKGFDVGAHTVSHPILKQIDAATARREIVSSRSVLQDVVGGPVRLFAYPNGYPQRDYGREHVEIVERAGFIGAVSSAWGVGRPSSDRFQLPRLRPWERSALRYAARMLYSRRAGPEARA